MGISVEILIVIGVSDGVFVNVGVGVILLGVVVIMIGMSGVV